MRPPVNPPPCRRRGRLTGPMAALAAALALLAGCGPTTTGLGIDSPDTVTDADVQRIVSSIPAAGADLSVPDAATVLADAPAPAVAAPYKAQDKPQGNPNDRMTRAEESSAMPMPG